MTRSLLLNSSWEPHQIIPSRRMLNLYLKHRVEPIEYDGTEYRSELFSVLIPSVARLKTYVTMPPDSRNVLLTTRAVLARDLHACAYCGLEGLTSGSNGNGTMDHVVPKALGGKHTWENVTASCKKCNLLKSHMTLEQLLDMGPDKPNVPGAKEAWAKRWVITRSRPRPRGVDAWLMSMQPDPAWYQYLQVAA